jgi:Arc/MetJ family transcription regulator
VYNLFKLYTKWLPMRTNIEIDDKLMEQALRLTGHKTKRAVVEEGLKTLVRLKQQAKMLDLAGQVEFWDEVIEDREKFST